MQSVVALVAAISAMTPFLMLFTFCAYDSMKWTLRRDSAHLSLRACRQPLCKRAAFFGRHVLAGVGFGVSDKR
ncbi:MAG: hypothetical protein ACLTQI_00480 [Slackia sp.]